MTALVSIDHDPAFSWTDPERGLWARVADPERSLVPVRWTVTPLPGAGLDGASVYRVTVVSPLTGLPLPHTAREISYRNGRYEWWPCPRVHHLPRVPRFALPFGPGPDFYEMCRWVARTLAAYSLGA